ncbi:hypothetical protein RE0356_34640 [Prescottella equi]|nr:hypothetical protein RE0356_34640 [Prescottella equi]
MDTQAGARRERRPSLPDQPVPPLPAAVEHLRSAVEFASVDFDDNSGTGLGTGMDTEVVHEGRVRPGYDAPRRGTQGGEKSVDGPGPVESRSVQS